MFALLLIYLFFFIQAYSQLKIEYKTEDGRETYGGMYKYGTVAFHRLYTLMFHLCYFVLFVTTLVMNNDIYQCLIRPTCMYIMSGMFIPIVIFFTLSTFHFY